MDNEKLIVEQAKKIVVLELQNTQYRDAMHKIHAIFADSSGPINGRMDRPVIEVMAQCQNRRPFDFGGQMKGKFVFKDHPGTGILVCMVLFAGLAGLQRSPTIGGFLLEPPPC